MKLGRATGLKVLRYFALMTLLLGFYVPAQAAVKLVVSWPSFTAQGGPLPFPMGVSDWATNQSFEVKFSVTNLGDEPATKVSVSRLLPAGIVIESGGTPQGDPGSFPQGEIVFPNPSNPNPGYDVEVLPPMASVIFNYQVHASDAGNYEFGINASCAESEADLTDNARTNTIDLVSAGESDLEVSLNSSQPSVAVGDEFTLTVNVFNKGLDTASLAKLNIIAGNSVYANDHLLDLVSGAFSKGGTVNASPSGGISYLDSFVLDAGETATLTAVYRTHTPGMVQFIASIGNAVAQPDANLDNNTVILDLPITGYVPEFDLEGELTMSPATVQPGGLLVEQLVVKNNGPDDATSVSVRSQFGDYQFGTNWVFEQDLDLHSILSAEGWRLEQSSNTLVGMLPSLPAGEASTVTLVFQVKENPRGQQVNPNIIGHGFSLESAYWLEHIGSDFSTVLHNNNPYAEVTINRNGTGEQSDLVVLPSAPREAPVDKPYSYTVKALNLGPYRTTTGQVSSIGPDGVSVMKATGDHGNVNVAGQYVSLDNVELEVGETATLNVTVMPRVLGNKFHEAGVASSQFDPNLANNLASGNTLVKEDGPIVDEKAEASDNWLRFGF